MKTIFFGLGDYNPLLPSRATFSMPPGNSSDGIPWWFILLIALFLAFVVFRVYLAVKADQKQSRQMLIKGKQPKGKQANSGRNRQHKRKQ